MSSTLKLSDIINSQAIFNIGTAGHVSHGKSTLVCALTGTKTQRFKKEQERNITIRLGYANCKFYLNQMTGQVYSLPSSAGRDGKPVMDPDTGTALTHLSTVSFVDCPGHELYMATMISGSKVMDFAMIVIAGNERIPRPQTHHHIIALGYSRIEDLSFALNKLDLVKEKDVTEIKGHLDSYLHEIGMDIHPVHPISAATGDNLTEITKFLASKVYARIPKTLEQAAKPLKMNIVRSYNVNRPNTKLESLVGAVVGGTIETGVLTVGDQVELRPGVITMRNGKKVIQPLVGRVISMESDHNELKTAIPGGLVGVSLSIYAGLSDDDHLKGSILGHVGTLPNMYDQITGKFKIIDTRIPGDKTTLLPSMHRGQKIDLVVNGISNVQAEITSLKAKHKTDGGSDKGTVTLKLKTPVVLDLTGANNIAIMIDRKLVASLSVSEGSLSMPVVYPDGTDYSWTPMHYKIDNDLVKYEHVTPSFNEMMSGINFRQKRTKRELYEYPDVTKINRTSNIRGDDFRELIDSMSFKSDADSAQIEMKSRMDIGNLLVENIASEFHESSPRFNGEGNLTMDGLIRKDMMVKFIDKFVQKLFTCPSCRGARCTLTRVEGTVRRHCHNCPSVTSLHTTNIGKIAN